MFAEGRRKHSAVESGIAALENQGLDRCFDHGVEGFECYVALAVPVVLSTCYCEFSRSAGGSDARRREKPDLERSAPNCNVADEPPPLGPAGGILAGHFFVTAKRDPSGSTLSPRLELTSSECL